MRGLRKNNSRQHGFLPLLRSRSDRRCVWLDELIGGFRNGVVF